MDKNAAAYNSKQIIDWYTKLHEIIPVEKKVFESYHTVMKQGNLLDIGIGGGRTTRYLLNKCKTYIGIDYSKRFINSVKLIFPESDCFVMDARNLDEFESERFDFVNFSFNGMDYTDLEGRKKIFSEIARVLKPGGIFFFSTHNRKHSSFNVSPWRNKNNSFATNIKTFIKLIPYLSRKIKNKKEELFTEDYALVNDSAHNYNLLTFYTNPDFLKTQLAVEDFRDILFYDKTGNIVSAEELDDWIFVTAKKSSL
jgi:SAM-dependent methyltransferase